MVVVIIMPIFDLDIPSIMLTRRHMQYHTYVLFMKVANTYIS